jgi:predicted dehydrogenase
MFITTTGEYPGANRFEVSGTKGKLLCDSQELWFFKNDIDTKTLIENSDNGFKKPNVEKILVETDGENPQHAGIINNFTAALLGKEELFVSGTDGLAGVELMNAIELSGWKGGERVSLPVNEDEYLEELNKKRAVSRLKTNVKSIVSDTEGTYGGNS